MKLKHTALLVLALITVSFFAGRYTTFGTRSAQYDQISTQDTIMKVYKVELKDRDQTIYEKNILIGTQREAIKAGLIDKELLTALNIKKAGQISNLEATLAAYKDSLDLSGDSIVFVTDTIIGSGDAESTYVKLPFSWNHTDDWLTLKTGIDANKQGHFNLNASAPFSITLGGRDGKQVASVTTPSPYITVTDFNVISLREEKWYYKPWVPAAGGFIGGAIAGWAIWGR